MIKATWADPEVPERALVLTNDAAAVSPGGIHSWLRLPLAFLRK